MKTVTAICFLCIHMATRTFHGYPLCEECFKKLDKKLAVYCCNTECAGSVGFLDNTDENINKICIVNATCSMTHKVNEIALNAFLTAIKNLEMCIIPIKRCPQCKEDNNGTKGDV